MLSDVETWRVASRDIALRVVEEQQAAPVRPPFRRQVEDIGSVAAHRVHLIVMRGQEVPGM